MATREEWEATAESIFSSFPDQVASVTYSQYVPGSYDPATDSYDGTPNTLVADMAILSNKDERDAPGVRELIGWMKAKDFRDGSIAEPLSVNDTITHGGVVHRITRIDRVPETDVPIAYRFTFVTRAK